MVGSEKDTESKYYGDRTEHTTIAVDTNGKIVGTSNSNQRKVMQLSEDITGYVPDKIGHVTRPHNEMMQRDKNKKKKRNKNRTSKKSRKKNRK